MEQSAPDQPQAPSYDSAAEAMPQSAEGPASSGWLRPQWAQPASLGSALGRVLSLQEKVGQVEVLLLRPIQ